MKNLSQIETWKQSFGLLPIHLKPGLNDSAFVMLNGGYSDFCLQTHNSNASIADYFSRSWSSNTKNFIVVDEEKIKIFNWAKSKPEEIASHYVLDNLDKFYTYLLSKNYKTEKDVVPFIIDIFRQFRNITQEKSNPIEALNLLFVLLTSLEEDYNSFDNKKWNVNDVNIPTPFEDFAIKLKSGIGGIKPELDLIIRHSAGALFQEAQKEVLFFNPQMDLFGGISSKIETRNNLYSSIHYTPPYLARTIVENVLRKVDLKRDSIKIFDPACGSSEFLIEILKQLKQLDFQGKIEIEGWDSSPTAINTSNFLLKYEQRIIWREKLNFKVTLVENSLAENWASDYDVILMNPPFISWELLSSRDLKESIRNVLGVNFSGRPNLASAFFYKSIQCLNNNGVIGCVIPTSVLTLDAYKTLREEINELISFELIGKLGNFVFEDALTDVSLIIGCKPKLDTLPLVLWAKNEKGVAQDALRDLRRMTYSNEFTVNENNYSIYQPLVFPIIQDSWKPVSLKENQLVKNMSRFVLEKKLYKVKDIFKVQQGINSGNNSLFKISKEEYDGLPKKEQVYFRPVLDSKAISNGQLFLVNYVWYPYGKQGLMLKTEHEFSVKVPTFYQKLLPHKSLLAKRSRKDLSNWWHLSEYRAWLLQKEPRLFSARFGMSNSFAFDKRGFYVIENGNAWLPKKEFTVNDYYFYLAIFSSTFFDRLLSIYSKQLSGGKWYDLGGKYTNEIPIPNVHLEEVKQSSAYNRLVEIGLVLCEGNLYAKSMANEVLAKYFYPGFD